MPEFGGQGEQTTKHRRSHEPAAVHVTRDPTVWSPLACHHPLTLPNKDWHSVKLSTFVISLAGQENDANPNMQC